MIEEKIISGYCRTSDQSRMVTLEIDEQNHVDVDCSYGSCPYETTCPIGKEITNLLENR